MHHATPSQHAAALLLDDPQARQALRTLRARSLLAIAGGLQFSIPRGRSRRGVTLVHVVSGLQGVQVIASRPTRSDIKEIDRAQGVLPGQLGAILARLTGVELSH
ncbi:hypothetical protein [Pseudomonas sp. C5pp]|uniref:hypothetical protein n=1 Tax=Pseudomonas sp. C5pp TaxID=1586081 RepID=UPI00057CEB41|nr:hypothetical protein [Pseudomonas sp. C5pp]KIC79733.1 hypothetical protein RR51_25335 [Pseudomonas sp. C5pp]